MSVYYITGNHGKFEEARLILKGWTLIRGDFDLPELQGDRHEIVYAKAKEALKYFQSPLIVEDVSLCCNAIGGLPGPYVKDFLKKIGDRGIYELIHKYSDHDASVICTAAFIAPGIEPKIFEGLQNGKIVAPRGGLRHMPLSWNPIFLPDGMERTFGEMSLEEHSRISMRSIALSKLRACLQIEAGLWGV